ncbi:MAG: SDR family oxidoreductase [Candidatus Thermoplasmatota archaeon]|nr:SDR family oxidoreductase [Candidatus Thermoplasmatota archaeon]
MIGKIVMITGATGGIGRETAKGLAYMGATVVLVSRSTEKLIRVASELKSETRNDHIDYLPCDLTSMENVRKLASDFKERYDRLDVLINNAGEIINERRTSVDGYEYTLALDHLSHFLLTALLQDIIKRSAPSKIINVSSMAHILGHINFDDIMIEKGYTPGKAYGQAKLANILFTYELARRLSKTGVTVNCLHPGMVRTNFGKDTTGAWKLFLLLSKPFMISARKGAQTSIYLASSPDVVSVTGKYFAKKKEKKSSKESYDENVAKRFWEISEKLTGMGQTHQE